MDDSRLVELLELRPLAGSTGLAMALLGATQDLVDNGGTARDVQRLCRVATSRRPNRGALAFAARALSTVALHPRSGYLDDRLELSSVVTDTVVAIKDHLVAARRLSAESLAATISGVRSVMTLCWSSTVVDALAEAKDHGLDRVLVLETRPGLDGLATAEQLSQYGLAVELLVDAAASSAIRDVEVVAVGADLVTTDGCLVNRIGTASLACVAARNGIPFHCAAPWYVLAEVPRAAVSVGERDATDVARLYPEALDAAVRIRNPPDDITDADLITAFSSRGTAEPPAAFVSNARDSYQQVMEGLIELQERR